MRLLRSNETLEAKRSLGGRDKVGKAKIRPLGPNGAVEAKRGRGG
jgi:hypothetical protein